MAVFTPKTFPEFFQRMLNRVVARTELTDLEVGGVLTTIVGAVARELDDMSYQMVALRELWDLDTATGIDLDARAVDCNPDEITRNGAVKAAGSVVFGRTNTAASVTVPAGTLVALVGGTPTYTTNADVILGVGVATSASTAVTAVVPGSEGNCDPADTSIPTGISEIVVNVAGIETVHNDTACSGGRDQESDSELRERIRAYLRSLPRATPDALKAAVLGVEVTGYGRIVTAQVEELPTPNYGQVNVWIDDGNGTTEFSTSTGTFALATEEVVIDPAIGGEIRLYLDHHALVPAVAPTVKWKDHHDYSGNGVDAIVELTEGEAGDGATTYDYIVNYATGKITLNPKGPSLIPDAATSTDSVAGLQSGDALYAEYTYYLGLISEAQKIIDGDPDDRTNYPGYRAAGVYVQVKAPTVYWQVIEASMVLVSGYDTSTVIAAAQTAIIQYINSLGVNGDVIFSELVAAVHAVEGVFDVTFQSPDQTDTNPNTIIGDGELARTRLSDMTISGG